METKFNIDFKMEHLRAAYDYYEKKIVVKTKIIEEGVIAYMSTTGYYSKEAYIAAASTLEEALYELAYLDGKLPKEWDDIEITPIRTKGKAREFFLECIEEDGPGTLVNPINPIVKKWVGNPKDGLAAQYVGDGKFK